MEKIHKIFLIALGLLASVFLILSSCNKMDDIQQKYAAREEQVYLGKVDSIQSFPGFNKVKLTWYISSDPRIDRTIIYWNLRHDSIVKEFAHISSGVQKDSVTINNLPQGTTLFEFRNVNNGGETSLYSSASLTVWGSEFSAGLHGREFIAFHFNYRQSLYNLTLFPTALGDGVVYSQIIYTNTHGEEKTVRIERDTANVVLVDFPDGGEFRFRTVFFLNQQGIDTIYSGYTIFKASVRGALGTYASPPRLANGRIDQVRLIAELTDIHANTYNWLIRNNYDDLEALKLFLPLARNANLKVWVTLLPPSEPPFSEPFKLDYEQWAIQLTQLSLVEPSLVAWSIDDFVHNLTLFTPEYVEKFLAACAVNPKFAFIPCCYFTQITPLFAQNYGHLLNGILFPYRAESVGANLQDASQVENEINKIRKIFGFNIPIFLDIYASAHSTLGATTPQYVKDVLIAGMKAADGVLIYTHQDPVKSQVKYQIIKDGFMNN